MEDISKVILTFKDQQYSLLKAKSKADAGPPATIAVTDIDASEKALALIKLSEDCPKFHGGSISFFKHEGKYIIFGGRDQALRDIANGKTHIAGHVLSSPALKATRIEKPLAETAKVEAVQQLANKFNSAPSTRVESKPRTSFNDRQDRPSYPRKTSGGTLHARSHHARSGS